VADGARQPIDGGGLDRRRERAKAEPGTFKDRTILRTNPYEVVEGALIAARAVGADQVIFGLKGSFGSELERVRQAVHSSHPPSVQVRLEGRQTGRH